MGKIKKGTRVYLVVGKLTKPRTRTASLLARFFQILLHHQFSTLIAAHTHGKYCVCSPKETPAQDLPDRHI